MEVSIMKQELEQEQKFEAEGFVSGSVQAAITLIVGMSVATVVIIFSSSLSAKTYELTEDDINAISNSTIKTSVQNAVLSGFEAQEQTANFLPLIVLAVVITLVLVLLLSMPMIGGAMGGRGGSAL